jgi:hypothetical protein
MVNKKLLIINLLIFLSTLSCNVLGPKYPFDGKIQTYNISMLDEDYCDLMKSSFLKTWFPAVVNDEKHSYDAGIQISGNIARTFKKKSFEIKYYTDYQKENRLILRGEFDDPSLCRYRLADYLFRKAGLSCPDIKLTWVIIDNNIHGLYLDAEPVNGDFLAKRGKKMSSLYEVAYRGRFTTKTGAIVEQNFKKRLPENDLTYTDLEMLIDIIDQGITSENKSNLEQWLDIKNFLDYYAACKLLGHSDGYVNNYYLYFDPDIRKFQIIPWDLTNTFITIADTLPLYENGLFEQFEKVPEYRSYLYGKVRELFNLQEMLTVLDSIYGGTENYIKQDPFVRAYNLDPDSTIGHVRQYLFNMDKVLRSTIH